MTSDMPVRRMYQHQRRNAVRKRPAPAEVTQRIARLRAVAHEIEGVRYVRFSAAVRALGVAVSVAQSWRKRGHVRELCILCQRRLKASRGRICMWRLDDLEDIARNYVPRQSIAWSQQEIDLLLEHAGRCSYRRLSRMLGRSMAAVRDRLWAAGVTQRDAQGWLTTGQAGQLLGRTQQAVQLWIKQGLPARSAPGSDPARLIEPRVLLHWIEQRPLLLQRLNPRRVQQLRSMADPILSPPAPRQPHDASMQEAA